MTPHQPATGFQHSDTFAALTEALAAAELEFGEIRKSSVNAETERQSHYADLHTLIAATRPALAKQGLVVMQITQVRGACAVVTTTLSHKSGEWISFQLEMPSERHDAWGIGSAMTYARRYSYQAVLNLAGEEDDDGIGAMGDAPRGNGKPPRHATNPPPFRDSDARERSGLVNFTMYSAFKSACEVGGRAWADVEQWLADRGIEGVEFLPKRLYQDAITWALENVKNGRKKNPEAQPQSQPKPRQLSIAAGE